MLASISGHVHVVCELLNDYVIDGSAQSGSRGTSRSASSTADLVRKRLTQGKADVNVKDLKGCTALYLASQKGQWDVVAEIMEHKEVDMNVQGPLGYTTLMWASLKGRLDIVTMILKFDNANANLKNIAGSTALDIALACDMFEVARFLEEHNKMKICCCHKERRDRRQTNEIALVHPR
ncbi:hypothetical protein MHU86_6836 [Fragilaria crotonensis]|nr:hypothetical protein MHU86_6836 [Fragilaria crotonensis]